MIQRIELHPPSLQELLPQFVAAKSLMFLPPKSFYTVSYVAAKDVLHYFEKDCDTDKILI